MSNLCVVFSGSDTESRTCRHTCARYVNLTSVLAWRDVSPRIRARFPTMKHVVDCGLMTPFEYAIYTHVNEPACRWFMPLAWVQKLIEKRLGSPTSLNTRLTRYDTQVATIATYGFFVCCLVGRQFLDPEKHLDRHEVDYVIPAFTILQFLFYVGWIKEPIIGDDVFTSDTGQLPPGFALPHAKQAKDKTDRPPKLHCKLDGYIDNDNDIKIAQQFDASNMKSVVGKRDNINKQLNYF
ncbi:unnamed protein product [Sphagnum balticum]